MRRVDSGELPADNVLVYVGRGEHDGAELAVEIGTAPDRDFAQGFHRQPRAHGVREDLYAADAWNISELAQKFGQGIARRRGGFLGCAVVEEIVAGRPGE